VDDLPVWLLIKKLGKKKKKKKKTLLDSNFFFFFGWDCNTIKKKLQSIHQSMRSASSNFLQKTWVLHLLHKKV
jgi:hypothetical protein